MQKKIMTTFLLSLAIILAYVIPPFCSIPDLNEIILIIIITLNKNYKKCLSYGLLLGVIAMLLTMSPNSQIPVLISKIATVNIVYLLIKILNKFNEKIIINVILFVGVFTGNMTYYTLWFWMNGILSFKYYYIIILELALIFILSAFANTIIGTNIYKTIKRILI